jgi:hypothetical protein
MPGGSAGVLRWLGFAGAVIGATLLTGREHGAEQGYSDHVEPVRQTDSARTYQGTSPAQPTGTQSAGPADSART